jgi:hypothetical protein
MVVKGHAVVVMDKGINSHLPKPPRCKLPGLTDLQSVLKGNSQFIRVHQVDSFYHISVAAADQEFLTVELPVLGLETQGKPKFLCYLKYKFTVLPKGMSWSPYVTNLVSKEIVETIRDNSSGKQFGETIREMDAQAYMDTFLVTITLPTFSATPQFNWQDRIDFALTLAKVEEIREIFSRRYGVTVCEERSVWTPTQVIEFMGLALINVLSPQILKTQDSIIGEEMEMQTVSEVFASYCYKGESVMVKELVRSELDLKLNKRNNEGETPLFMACAQGHSDVVRHLMMECLADMDMNITNNIGSTPLYEACSAGHSLVVREMLKLKLSTKLDVNMANNWGGTPIRSACSQGNEGVLRELLQGRPEIILTPGLLNMCAKLDNVECVEILLNTERMDVEAMWSGAQTWHNPPSPHYVGKRSPLQEACYSLSHNVVEYLLFKCDGVCFTNLTEAGNTHSEEVDRALANSQEFLLEEGHRDEDEIKAGERIKTLLRRAEDEYSAKMSEKVMSETALKYIKPSANDQ